METIISLIEKQKTGDVQATQEICRRMTPLLKKYAAKLYCMEYDDAMQELYIALLETLPYLNPTKTEAECLNYIKTTVHNRYRFLCRGCLSVLSQNLLKIPLIRFLLPLPLMNPTMISVTISKPCRKKECADKLCLFSFSSIKLIPKSQNSFMYHASM